MSCVWAVRETTRIDGRVRGAVQYTSKLLLVSLTLICMQSSITAVLAGSGA